MPKSAVDPLDLFTQGPDEEEDPYAELDEWVHSSQRQLWLRSLRAPAPLANGGVKKLRPGEAHILGPTPDGGYYGIWASGSGLSYFGGRLNHNNRPARRNKPGPNQSLWLGRWEATASRAVDAARRWMRKEVESGAFDRASASSN